MTFWITRALLSGLLSGVVLFAVTACDNSDTKKEDAKKQKKSSLSPADRERNAKKGKRIEAFTGAHTRIVWTESDREGTSDSFALSNRLILRGLDTRDGLGERRLLKKVDNYSRPLLNSDGTVILYTDKNTERKDGVKHYSPVIYRTDWESGESRKVAKGYAVDTWKDPATGVEWVYAVTKFRSSTRIALEARQVIRFQLEDPSKEELIYDDTPVGPDNIQLSRDGSRASGLFPWPHTGVFVTQDGNWKARKLLTGCWPSMAPDDSGISWVFDGEHRSAFFYAADGKRSWVVDFSTAPNMRGHELYHPRWSNHARYFALTGPYVKDKNESGSVIGKGGASAQVFIGKFSATADKVEDWLQITSDNFGESYPDVWIKGGEKFNLEGSDIASDNAAASVVSNAWPVQKTGLLMLWHDREALNNFTSRDGSKLETTVESFGSARFGRLSELRVDGGSYQVEEDGASKALPHLQENKDFTLESVVLPPEFGSTAARNGNVFRAPGVYVAMKEGHLLLGQGNQVLKSGDALPEQAFHLAVTRKGGEIEAYVNGQALTMNHDQGAALPSAVTHLVFGGDWDGGMLDIALHDERLDPGVILQASTAAATRIAAFPPPPPRVKLLGKLVETSSMPTEEGIAPYTSSLVDYVYQVEKVLEGSYDGDRVLVKHWAMLGKNNVQGFPREEGKSYELILERASDHPHLRGERVMDDTTVFDLESYFDVSPPRTAAP